MLPFQAIKRLKTALVVVPVFMLSIAAHLSMAQELSQATAVAPRVILPASTHSATRIAPDLGRVEGNAAMDRMVLMLAPDASHEKELQMLLDNLHTKGSPQYHQWLTPEEFGARFGASPAATQKVSTWLAAQGFSINSVARSGRWIQFSGTAAQVEVAFQTEMHHYLMNGTRHIANATDLSLPAELSALVKAVLPLHDFSPKRPVLGPYFAVHRDSQGKLVPTDPRFTNSNPGANHFVTPGDYAKIYDLASLYQNGANGAGQTIAVVGRSNVEVTDVETFRTIFGLPPNSPTIIIDGPDPGFTGSGDSVEASLDVEWAGAIAPNAAIDLVISASTATTDGVDLSSAYIIDNNLASIMTVSFGACEGTLGAAENTFFNSLWQQAAAQGISVLVAAGDSGAAGCDNPNVGPATGGSAVSGLASTPFNTAVGGTQFNENGNDSTFWNLANGSGFTSSLGYIPETPWNESCDPALSTCFFNQSNLFAGGGGASTIYVKPAWQVTSIPGVPNDGHRDIPDVSLASATHDGYLVCFAGSCQTTTDSQGQPVLLNATIVGGTSAAAPAFAAIMAIVDQQTNQRQGLANYALYPMAAAENFANCSSSSRTNPAVASTCIFNDVTAGNNSVPGQPGFNAGLGYDLATGLGSVNAANLVQAFVTQSAGLLATTTALVANGVTAVQHGQPVSFTVNVAPISGVVVPTGNVSIITSLPGAAGPGSFVTAGGGALTNGVFTAPLGNLPGGQYNVSAHYSGDSNFQASNSNAVAVNITKENSTTVLSPDGETNPYGLESALHAVVAGVSGQGIASGTMTFFDGTTQLAVLPLNSAGQADFVPIGPLSLGLGTHTISASYSGDNSFNPSTAQPVTVTIAKGFPGIGLFALSSSAFAGTGTVTISVFVSNTGPILPTGTVQLFKAGSPVGSPAQLVQKAGAPPTVNFSGFTLTPEIMILACFTRATVCI